MVDKNKGYNGNTNLLKVGTKIEYTPEMALDLARCKEDPVYFAETHFKIIHVDHGLQPMKLYDFQKDAIRLSNENRKLLVCSGRQQGKTTIATVIILHYAMFNPGKRIALLANKGDTAREILSRIQLAYEHLPLHVKQAVKYFNKSSMHFENESIIIAAASSSSAIRGKSCAMLYIDECVSGNTKITIRNKITGEIREITIEEAYATC